MAANHRKEVIEKCEFKSKLVYDKLTKKKRYVCEMPTRKHLIEVSQRYLSLICCEALTDKRRKEIVQKTIENFYNFYNKGYLEYRKSVTEAKDFAAIEWEGEGSIIKDIFGREYIDFLGGYGLYNMGIKHPKIVDAVKSQLMRTPMNSQELLEPLRGALAQLLGELAPGDLQGCFFINNGTDAVEGALKLARMYTKKPGFIAAVNGFHGKTMGSLSVMGKQYYRKPFEPLLDQIHFVPFGDAGALEAELKKLKAVGQEIAAFIVEPVQGEGGIIVPPEDYLPKARKICDKYGILLILDEVQTGMGRTGKIFACEHYDVVPDIICLGKSLGGGVIPLSAFIANSRIWGVLEKEPFIHSSTTGGNSTACAAGIAAINVLLSEKLPEQAAKKGKYALNRLKKIRKKYGKYVVDVRGQGLMLGIEFIDDKFGYEVAAELFRKNVLVAGTLINSKTIRIEPALNIPDKLLKTGLDRLDSCIKEAIRHFREKNGGGNSKV